MQTRSIAHRRLGAPVAVFLAACVAAAALLAGAPEAAAAQQQTRNANDKIWNSLKAEVFGDRPIQLDTGLVSLDAPKRAQDAAIVPVDIRIDPLKAPAGVKSLTLIVDVNPAPVAATFVFGEGAGVTKLSTRLRINDYSYVRAIAETNDGQLHMTQSFVKASGGCSAPALKNQDEAMASMGQMKLRQFPVETADAMTKMRELQLMIRHPNNSGFQRDPLTQYFIPAHFVHTMKVSQGDRLILSMEGGISISEDPNFRFDFVTQDEGEISVEAVDTEGKSFRGQWPLEATGL